jgi:beta-N-acetylhexosaminidase
MTRGTWLAFLVIALLTLGASGTWAQDAPQAEPASTPTDRVSEIMAGMSMRQKIGQLFMSRIYGDRAIGPGKRHVASNRRYLGVDDAAELMSRYHVGSIVYFGYAGNLKDAERVAALSNGIQAAAAAAGDLPVLISTDQEHGSIRRLGPPATLFPGAMAIGATRDQDLARAAARVTGAELRAVGIRQNLAPVADVNADPRNPVIGIRSFGSRPDHVAAFVSAQVQGLQQDAGVAATAKHFPGHGDTNVDSHVGMPIIRNSRAHWWAVDAPPFEAAIDAGVDVIMTAHVVVPALDRSRRPATLSRPILTGVLREAMGYDGVVMTDSLSMVAVRERYSDKRIPVLALKAGADVLADPPDLRKAYAAVVDAVESGELTMERIDESVERVLRLKARLGLLDQPFVDETAVKEQLGSVEHKAAARAVSDAGTTVLRYRQGWLPVPKRWSVLLTGWNDPGVRQVTDRLRASGREVETRWTRADPTKGQIKASVKAARKHDVTFVFTSFISSYPRQRKLVRELLISGGRVVIVNAWSPYDVAWFPWAPGHILTYGTTPVSMRSLAKVLAGEVRPTGKLPVRIPKLQQPKSTLFPFGYGKSWSPPV